jgi:hypothetical protein
MAYKKQTIHQKLKSQNYLLLISFTVLKRKVILLVTIRRGYNEASVATLHLSAVILLIIFQVMISFPADNADNANSTQINSFCNFPPNPNNHTNPV